MYFSITSIIRSTNLVYVNGPDEGISFVAILPSEAYDLSNDTSNANISFAEDNKKRSTANTIPERRETCTPIKTKLRS